MDLIRRYFKSLLMYGVVVSGIAALAEWGTFGLAVFVADIHYLIASVMGFLVGATVNASMSRRFGFVSKGRSVLQEYLLLYGAGLGTFAFNALTLWAFVEILRLNPMVGKIAGTGVAFFLNYGLRQFFIFSSEPRWK